MTTFLQRSLSLLALVSTTLSLQAWHLNGKVTCPDRSAIEGAIVNVSGTTAAGAYSASGVTDALGEYEVALPDNPGTFTATLDTSSLPAGSFVVGAGSVSFTTTDQDAWP